MDIKRDVTIKSWDGTWTYHPKVIVAPESAEDLVETLTDEVRFPAPVRPAGSMHSTARMNGDDGGTMVDMTKMNRILHFTEDTVTVEAGATYIVVSDALKDRGLQFHVTTEIGNVTLGAMATAATKDSSFPGGFGQVSSYVTAVRLVTPQGKLREINERDNPEEMQIIRSSYGLMGIVYEVTIRVRPTTALSVRHYSLSLDNFRRYYPIYKARGFAVMYYIFPYVKRVLVELRKEADFAVSLGLPQPLLAQIRARRHAMDRKDDEQSQAARLRRQAALLPAAPGTRLHRAQRLYLATRPDYQLQTRSRAEQISVQHVVIPRGRLLRRSRRILQFLHRL
jgi:FAD/FMN-containing dehydrogenase